MFSNLSQNSILYIFDLQSSPKILSGPIERVSIPRPKYNTFNPNLEMVVDITATINGERREFKGVPNSSIANFGEDSFVLAENRDALNSYINAMLQNSKNILNSVDKHKQRVIDYEEALQELNPEIKVNKENDKAIQNLQEQIKTMQKDMQRMLSIVTKKETETT
jgi:predicted RNase H-like nuclease (RuvC/YqgF family)